MRMIQMTEGTVHTNVYLLSDENGNAALIDPAANAEGILAQLSANGLTLRAIFLTHAHFDHFGAVEEVARQTGAPLYLAHADAELLTAGEKNGSVSLVGRPAVCRTKPTLLHEGDRIAVGHLTVSVTETPGHTRGSVCYFLEEDGAPLPDVFTGDTVFAEGYGRTDLYGGDHAAMWASLKKILPLLRGKTAHPGHGPSRSF